MVSPTVWVMQYYDRDGNLLTWPEYFKTPDDGEIMLARMRQDKTEPKSYITSAWYKELSLYENERKRQDVTEFES